MKHLRNFIGTVAAVVLVSLTIELLTSGMPLMGVPSPQDVAAVTVTHTTLTDEIKQFADGESIDLACKLPGFLRYSLWGDPNESRTDVITITYELKTGESISLSANRETVWWKGTAHRIKDENTFVKLAEGIFFWPEVAEGSI